jgi:hypothetical protein
MGGETLEKPVEPVPAVYVGDAKEMEVTVVVRDGSPDWSRGNIESVSYGDMGFFIVPGTGHLILCDLIGDADGGIRIPPYGVTEQKVA